MTALIRPTSDLLLAKAATVATASARPPMARGYARVSTEQQYSSQLGLEAQEEAMVRGYEYKYKPTGHVWCGTFSDPHEMSAKVPLLHRPAGKALDLASESGDVIIMPKLDRGFRSMEDAVLTLKHWKQRGIIVYFAAEGLELSDANPMGKMFSYMLAMIAEMERDRISERTKSALAAKRRRGEHLGEAPTGFRVKNKKLAPDEYEQSVMALVAHLVIVQRCSAKTAATLCDRIPIKLRKIHVWTSQTITRILAACEKYQIAPSLRYWDICPHKHRISPSQLLHRKREKELEDGQKNS